MTRAFVFSILLAAPVAVTAGCGGSGSTSTCLGSKCVAVSTATYNADFTGMGTLDTVNLSNDTPKLDVDPTLDPDVTMKVEGDELFVLMRDTGSLRIYDPTTFMVKEEIPTGDATEPSSSSYPQDFWVDNGGNIWVTLSGNDAAHSLAIIDRATKALVYVGLPQDPTDTDGKPEPFQLYTCDGHLYVTTQNYTINSDDTVSYAQGRVIEVDPTDRSIRFVISLQGQNPFSMVDTANGNCYDVVVASAGGLTTVPDGKGNLERLDLGEGVSKGVLVTDTQLDGRPTLLASSSLKRLYVAMYYDPEPDGTGQTLLSSVKVVTFDVDTLTLGNTITGAFGNVNFLQLHDSKLFLGAGIYAGMEESGKEPRGLYISPDNGEMVTTTAVDLQLTPSAIALPN